ncbi:hypothetical protein RJ55_01312 [Drechmeria coniospora]|nr:hypothetical protein RJ55_01312 [Drechmeria coniospora]
MEQRSQQGATTGQQARRINTNRYGLPPPPCRPPPLPPPTPASTTTFPFHFLHERSASNAERRRDSTTGSHAEAFETSKDLTKK